MGYVESFQNAGKNIVGLGEKEPIGIGGFFAMAVLSGDLTMTSEVPDSYLEDGSFGNDHIILKADEISLEISVSDVFAMNQKRDEVYKKARAEVGNVTKYAPNRTTAQLAKVDEFYVDTSNAARKIEVAYQDGAQVVDLFGDNSDGNFREQFVKKLRKIHQTRELISLQIAYTLLDNMRLTSITLKEDNQTEEIVCSIKAKQLRFVKTELTAIETKFEKPSDATGGKTSGAKPKGKQAGKKNESLGTAIINSFFG